jgi:hypothetical protein
MRANSTGSAQAFLSASDAAVSQEVDYGKIRIQLACALNTRYIRFSRSYKREFKQWAVIRRSSVVTVEEKTLVVQ